MLRTCSVVDATLIDASSSTKNQDGKRGPEMHQVKKGNQWLKASIRAKVEHPFRVVKCQFGFTKVRYRGLVKNTAQLTTLFTLSNLWMARKHLIGATV